MWYTLDEISLPKNDEMIDIEKQVLLVPQMNYAPEMGFVDQIRTKDSHCSSAGSFVQTGLLPSSVELFSMHPLYENAHDSVHQIVFRFAQLNPWAHFETTQIDLRAWFSPSLSFSSIEERTLSLLHKLDDHMHKLTIPTMSMRTFVATVGENPTLVAVDMFPHNPLPVEDASTGSTDGTIYRLNNPDEMDGILVAGDLPLLPGQTGAHNNSQRVHILTESLRSSVNVEQVTFPVHDYYFFLTCCCIFYIFLLVLFIQKRSYNKPQRYK